MLERMKGVKKQRIVVLGILVFVVFGVLIINSSIQEPRINSNNARRVSDIGQMNIAFALYFQKHNTYPDTSPGCQDLSTATALESEEFIGILPRERREQEGHPSYQYAVAADGSAFVVKATLDESSYHKSALLHDLDGSILGCECDDPNYCLGSSLEKPAL